MSGILPGPIDGIIGGVASAGISAVLHGMTDFVTSGAAKLLGGLVRELDLQTRPDLSAGWFSGQYTRMMGIATLFASPLLFATAITSIVRQDASPVLRAIFVNLPLAAIGTGVAISLTNLALAATDSLCGLVASTRDIQAIFGDLASTLDTGFPGRGEFAVVIVALLIAFGALLLSLEMIVRSSAIYVAVFFLPVALVGLTWPVTARWGKRLAELLVSVILSKFVVVAIIGLAVAGIRGGAEGQGMSGLLSGAALIMLACVAPFALLRMAPIVEAGAMAHLDGTGRRLASTAAAIRQPEVLDRVLKDAMSRSQDGGSNIKTNSEPRTPIGTDGKPIRPPGESPSAGAPGTAGTAGSAGTAGTAGAAAAGGPAAMAAQVVKDEMRRRADQVKDRVTTGADQLTGG